MPALKAIVVALAALLLTACSGDSGKQAVVTRANWTSYVGSHYTARSWAGSVRDPGGAGQVGYDAQNPAGSWTTFQDTLTNNITPLLPDYYQVISAEGLGSGRDPVKVQAYMDAIQLDSGAGFRDGMYQRAKAVASLNGAVDKVFWQFGNEINSQMYSDNLHLWDGSVPPSNSNDPTTIPWFVEYFLAPGIEGVRQASQELYGNPGRIHIMLGSVVAAGSVPGKGFLNALLDYQITGNCGAASSCAPTLQGMYVRDLVDTVSIHYTLQGGNNNWHTFLNGLYINPNRIGQSGIRSVFSTEEVGQGSANQGTGMGVAVKVFSRYMDWWLEHNMSPEQGHVFFYGSDIGPAGTTIDGLMPTLYGFLGDVPLGRPASPSVISNGNANIESYEYESGTQRRRMISVFSSDTAATLLNSITVNVPGWSNLVVEGHLYTATGDQAVTPVVALQPDGKYLLSFNPSGTPSGTGINANETLLLLLRE